ncbi:FMN-binding protein [Spirillospora sp. CA-255316]
MRRTTAAVAGTLTGTALLLAAKFGTSPPDPVAAGQAADETGGAAPAPSSGPSGRAGPSGPAGATAVNGLKNGVFRGAVSVNPHGPIQVTIRVAGGRITGVTATHATSPAKTVQVNRRAIPVLRQEALAAQSARIDTVSGATYTSGSFTASLESALAAARA